MLKWISKSFIWSVNCSSELNVQTDQFRTRIEPSNDRIECIWRSPHVKIWWKIQPCSVLLSYTATPSTYLSYWQVTTIFYVFSYFTAMHKSRDKKQVCWTKTRHYKEASYAAKWRIRSIRYLFLYVLQWLPVNPLWREEAITVSVVLIKAAMIMYIYLRLD